MNFYSSAGIVSKDLAVRSFVSQLDYLLRLRRLMNGLCEQRNVKVSGVAHLALFYRFICCGVEELELGLCFWAKVLIG